MLTLGIFVGLLLGLAAGGSLANLASVRLRWIWALSLAVIVRFLTEAALAAGVDIVETLPRTPSGKVLKRELRDRYRSPSAAG